MLECRGGLVKIPRGTLHLWWSIETVKYIWVNIWCMLLEFCHKKLGLVTILHYLSSYQHNNYVAFSLLHVLLRGNHKINDGCFPSFHNGCNPTCKAWRRLRTGESRNTWKVKYRNQNSISKVNLKGRLNITIKVKNQKST